MMKRIFYPVGQGAFYAELFEGAQNFTFVYDCGGSNQGIIKREIDENFTENQVIDALFISHFHNDHINGLKHFLDYADVKKIFLPFLHNNKKIQLLIENIIYGKGDNFINEVILNPVEKLGSEKVVFVKPYFSDKEQDNEIVNIDNISNEIESGTKISKNNLDWIYVPYNFQYDNFSDRLAKELEKEGINFENIVEKLKVDKKFIQNVYKDILKGKLNENSLVVYSGPKNVSNTYNLLMNQNKAYSVSDKAGCLYTGDFDAKNDTCRINMKKALQEYWQYIGTVQIPHHGSNHNFHVDLAWENSTSVISTGFKYRHPSAKVIKQILKQGSVLYIVSDNEQTRLQQFIEPNFIMALAKSSNEFYKFLTEIHPEYFL